MPSPFAPDTIAAMKFWLCTVWAATPCTDTTFAPVDKVMLLPALRETVPELNVPLPFAPDAMTATMFCVCTLWLGTV